MTDPAAMPLVDHRCEQGVEVLVVRAADIYQAEVIEDLRRELRRAVEASQATRFVLDLSNVKFLSSSALGIILSVQRRVVQRKGELMLAGIREGVLELFGITKLDTVFPIYKDAASAVEAFRRHPERGDAG
jgi:anti-sigma B factor antagonist